MYTPFKGLEGLSAEAMIEPNSNLLQLIEAYCRKHGLQMSDQDAVAQHLSGLARILHQSVMALLRQEITLEELSPLEAKLLCSVLPSPTGEPLSYDDFVFHVTGRHLQSASEDDAIALADAPNGRSVA
jgi:hypothetical protein